MSTYSLLYAIRLISIEHFLRYPITCSIISTCLLFFPPVLFVVGNQWKLAVMIVGFLMLLAACLCTYFIPVLVVDSEKVILRPKPTCSTSEKQTRFLYRTSNDQNLLFVLSASEGFSESDIKNASKYYITSDKIWLDEFSLIMPVEFQTEDSNGKRIVQLKKGDCVRAAGKIGLNPTKVLYTIIDRMKGEQTAYLGYIESYALIKIDWGLYSVSNCSSELSRWWYKHNHISGYVDSYSIVLKQGGKILL